MDRLAGLDRYFKEKDRKKLDKIAAETNSLGVPTMTKDEIRQSCIENGGYETPELNDKIYLHFRGFKKIENLECYTGCKAIWLDSNGLDTIEGLDLLTGIRCLYMSKNLISKIQNLSTLTELVQLDLSSNRITKIEGLSSLVNLDSINLSRNALTSPESIEHLKECPNLRTVDLQNNRLEANENFISLFQSMPALSTLSINGNEVTKVQTFRKRIIHAMPKLGYLDRPVEESERLAATAFMTGGPEAEKVARDEWRAKQAQERQDQMNSFREWQKDQQKLRQNMSQEQRTRIEVEDNLRTEKREAAADASASMERRAIQEIGIQKISMRVAELEAAGRGGANVVNEAQRELLQELDDSRRVVELDENDLPIPPVSGKSTNLDELDDDEEYSPPPVPVRGVPLTGSVPGYENAGGTLGEPTYSVAASADEGKQYPEHSQARVRIVEEAAVVPPPAQVESAVEIAARETAAYEAQKAAEEAREVKKKAQAEEDARQERIAESVAIYKAQKAAAQAKKGSSPTESSKPMQSSWDAAIQLNGPVVSALVEEPAEHVAQVVELGEGSEPIPAALFWSEDMDIILAKQVQACVFDFDRISETVKARFPNAALTAEACRLRWADLDAGEQNALDTNFTCYVSDNIITKGHGAQPTFDSLSSMARGQFPAYLKAPNAFPSVGDLSDEDSDDEKENGANGRAVLME